MEQPGIALAGKYSDLKPAFSPDGKKVFFVEPSWRALRSRI
jgi:hypothetical protein